MSDPDHHPLIRRAIDLTGGQEPLAQKMGVAQQTISKLLNRQRSVSAELAKAIHDATDGAVACWELRPDLWSAPRPKRRSGGMSSAPVRGFP